MIKLKNLINEQQTAQVTTIAYDLDGVLCDFEKQFIKLLRNDVLWNAAVSGKKAISNAKLEAAGITREQWIRRATEIRDEVLAGDGDHIEVIRNRFKDEFNHRAPSWTMIGMAGEDYWATMDWMPGGQELVKYIESLPIPKIVITAGFGAGAKNGKRRWLKDHGLGQYTSDDKFNIMNAGREKGKAARPGILLVDDKPENIEIFKQAGGLGVIHRNTPDTISQLKKYYE
jgi:hypothetical protein